MSKYSFTWNGKALTDMTREELIAALEISMATKDAMVREGIRMYQVQGYGELPCPTAKKERVQ